MVFNAIYLCHQQTAKSMLVHFQNNEVCWPSPSLHDKPRPSDWMIMFINQFDDLIANIRKFITNKINPINCSKTIFVLKLVRCNGSTVQSLYFHWKRRKRLTLEHLAVWQTSKTPSVASKLAFKVGPHVNVRSRFLAFSTTTPPHQKHFVFAFTCG